jgi:hypothetical protein
MSWGGGCATHPSIHPSINRLAPINRSHPPSPSRTPPPSPIIRQHASLTPEQEAKRFQMTRQVQELDEQIQAKAEEKRRIDKEIDGLLAQKRTCVGWVGLGWVVGLLVVVAMVFFFCFGFVLRRLGGRLS